MDPKSSIFDIFAIFVDFFCGRFSEACFGGLWPPILEDFRMTCWSIFDVFCEAWRVAWRCKNHRFVLVFTVFGGYRPFYKKQKNQKNAVRMEGVLREGCRHNFFIDFGSILTSILAPFWHIFRHFWQWILKAIFDIDFWRDFRGKRSKKTVIPRGRWQRRGLLRCQRQPKTQWSDTPSTLPKAGAADLRRLGRVPGAAPEAWGLRSKSRGKICPTGHDRPLPAICTRP